MATPITCDRLEHEQFDSLDSWIATAAVNRLDLAPEDGAHCGQQRLVFANTNFVGNGRMFMIVEAQIPNPAPECGISGCLMLAQAWDLLASGPDPLVRGGLLRQAFLDGRPLLAEGGFGPFPGEPFPGEPFPGGESSGGFDPVPPPLTDPVSVDDLVDAEQAARGGLDGLSTNGGEPATSTH